MVLRHEMARRASSGNRDELEGCRVGHKHVTERTPRAQCMTDNYNNYCNNYYNYCLTVSTVMKIL